MSTQAFGVKLQGVRKLYAAKPVLSDIDLAVAAGETVILIGPSGCGKSTLLRCINGLTTFEAGAVEVGPHALRPEAGKRAYAAQAAGIRRVVGMVFQDFRLFPHLTALANVIEAPVHVLGLPRRDAEERARALLARVGLADRAEHYPRQLSGGQQQRVAIARALAMAPRALLCDEITSALDPELKNEVLSVVEGLKRDGITLIMVTHEMGFARRAADRVVVLDGGVVIEQGVPAEVLDRPQAARTRQFLSQVLG